MSATEFEDTGAPLPRISEIRALPDFRLGIVWARGSRTGRADFVDLAPVINTYKLYRPLRNNEKLFQTARLVDHGKVVEWGDGTIDMPAELLEDIANEAMTPQDEARSGSHRERQLPPETLPNMYEQVTKETRAMLSQVAQHFTEQVKEMRSEMRREIEAMRDELRKSILGLPHETAEGAAQMRRVIVDQIEALAELNRIVARHGRNLDIVEPIEIEPAEPPPPRDAARETQARETHVPPLQSTKGAAEPRGWLSGLLTRAAQDTNAPPREATGRGPPPDAARGERHAIESLDSIAVDIARMIDHAAAAELWDRYKRGERDVFTHMLCTMQGQRAVEDIRWRYSSDREFMQTVDRYIDEFERLLDEVSHDDRGEMVARSYLSSETGQVYTMLAYSADRFDR